MACAAAGAVALLAIAGASCGDSHAPSPATVTLVPSIIVPQGIINQIAVFSLTIYTGSLVDGGVGCDPKTGMLTGDVAKTTPLYGPVMNATNSPSICGAGFNRCFVTPKLVQSPYPRFFGVTGYSDPAHTKPIAYGCNSKILNGGADATTASLPITMVPIPPKEVCGNGTLEPPETCDPPSPAGSGAAAILRLGLPDHRGAAVYGDRAERFADSDRVTR